ncbi:hypothetical protein BJ944DRAFT_169771 [Cunninghamella echinulata]|nr:hypothetical protein BJ944DRAFT_169771 [Cunninghamella echinulata]
MFNQPIKHGRTLVERLRMLRQDAQQQYLLQASIFYAEKVMAITNNINDVYWLAEAYYQAQHYEQALDLLNTKETISKSVQCRYLAGLCAMALKNYHDAIDYLGHTNPFKDSDFKHDSNFDGSIKLESIMCFTRGNAYLHLNDVQAAKVCFIEALKVDVKCYDALDTLIKYNMLTEKEEWELLETIDYYELCEEDADMIKSLYQLRLKRFSHKEEIVRAQHIVENECKLTKSLDVMQSTAETLLSESKYEECLTACQKIKKCDGLYRRCIPLYLTCLYELRMQNELYELGQELVARIPNEAVTWHAVGMYYLLMRRYAEAKQYFRHATEVDQYFEAAWLGFAHCFAAENNHELAINAYNTCSRLIPGSHLPYMYLGTQYMEQYNMEDAIKYLDMSLTRCKNDPYVYNEYGVYYYNMGKYQDSIDNLQTALQLAKKTHAPSSPIWEQLWANIGHAYRKLMDYEKALRCFKIALAKNPGNSNVHAGIGLIYHLNQKIAKAITQYNLVNRYIAMQG